MEPSGKDPVKDAGDPERDLSAERREEDRRIRILRRAVDFSLWIIRRTDITLPEAQNLVQGVRERALSLFPGKESAFDLIYAPRFRRAMAERFRLQ
ncbi:MAG: hypothetical protein MUF52_10730 [Syntrophobacteraceae bacterium]|jgi:hypothetical protein|nr:hypothetical protein [Syntrophobacteraceae bacterium]